MKGIISGGGPIFIFVYTIIRQPPLPQKKLIWHCITIKHLLHNGPWGGGLYPVTPLSTVAPMH